jgi:hypothetical protein
MGFPAIFPLNQSIGHVGSVDKSILQPCSAVPAGDPNLARGDDGKH